MSHPEMRQWYVVYSKPHKEEWVQIHLLRKGIEVFLPRLHLPESARKCGRIVPLFPSYLFVKIQIPQEYHYVIWSPGVKHLVSFNGVPAPIDEEVVMFLRRQASQDGVIQADSTLTVGQEVQVTGGPFEGLVAIIQEPPDAKGRVKILLNLLSRKVKVEVPIDFIESGWVVPLPRVGDGDIEISSPSN